MSDPGRVRPLPDRRSAPRTAVAQVNARSRRERAEQEFEALLSELSRTFVNISPDELDGEIERWLRRLVEFVDADRGWLLQLSADGHVLHTTHSHAAEGDPAFPVIATDSEFPWFVSQVREGRVVRLERLPDDLPPEAAAERTFVLSSGFKSYLMLPFTIAGLTRGGLGFGARGQYRAWSDPLVKRLQLVAEVMGSALARKEARRLLEERLEFEQLITDLVKEFVSVDPRQLDDKIQQGLQRLVGHSGVDRTGLGRIVEDQSLVLMCSAQVDMVPPPPSRITLPWYIGELREGRSVQISEALVELPPGADAERAYARESGIRSHLGIPLMSSGRLWGMIEFAAFFQPRHWTEEQAQRLGLVGEIMMGAMLRREVDERSRRQRAELAHVARVAALGELTAALAHELNQPLAAIRTNAQATRRVLARGRQPDNLDEILSDIVRDATRAGDLIQRLRNLLRNRELERVHLDINEVIRSVEPIAATETRRHGARLVLDLTPELPRISGDALQLQQVLLNLVRNAAEAMVGTPPEARGVVVRTAVEASEQIMVSVLDGGPPVDQATIRDMFTPFHTTKPDGLGMGLAISLSIIGAHGGRLWAVPRESAGLAVQFSLPLLRTGGA